MPERKVKMIDYSKSIMETLEKHLSPTPQYVDKRKTFGVMEVTSDPDTERIIEDVEGGVCGAIAADELKPFAGGMMRKTTYRVSSKKRSK